MKNIVDIIKEEIDDLRYQLAGYKHDEKLVSYNKVYHVTPIQIANEILLKGIIKNSPSSQEPEAIYLTSDIHGAVLLCKRLSEAKRIKTDWVILKINSTNLKLYKDPYSIKEAGIYTYDNIPKELIKFETIVDGEILKNNNNWKLFWNWWFWGSGTKPDFIKKFALNQYNIK
jgi:hypothetical protein